MELKHYFESTTGTGILATADAAGNVNGAVYARPHFMDNGSIAFIMNDRLSHHNLTSNPKAAYIFIETGSKRAGKRLYLSKTGEESDPDTIAALRRRQYDSEGGARTEEEVLWCISGSRRNFLVGRESDVKGPTVRPTF